MDIRLLNDTELLAHTKQLVSEERQLVTKLLHHLREVERRRLYSELGCASLFDYAVRVLKYSESQASRRISAMRLIKEIPEIEAKLRSGALSLSNLSQVSSFFREAKSLEPKRVIQKHEKLAVIAKLENKSTREAQRELLTLQPKAALPKERERIVSEEFSEVRFLMSEKLKAKLEEVRALLGPRGASLNYAELFEELSEIGLVTLKAKRFGKKRSCAAKPLTQVRAAPQTSQQVAKSHTVVAASQVNMKKNPRYIPTEMKHQIWQRDGGQCKECGTKRNLNFDHLKPVALGGCSTVENLRLLCFSCNQRAGIRSFGIEKMEKYSLEQRPCT